jgi:prepilin-type N-terminal cleavage/methylation domain-containing protein
MTVVSEMNTINNRGFTLIEIMVAATIFSFAILGLAIGTVSVIQNNQNSHWHTSAINLAQAKLEEFRAMSSAAFSSISCASFELTGCHDNPGASGMSFERSWQVTSNSPVTGVSQVDVRVTWTDYTSRSVTFTASVPQ